MVWGPFSVVWGLGVAGATLLLYRYKDKSDSFIFLAGTFLGGAYEYLCSVFSELVFHLTLSEDLCCFIAFSGALRRSCG